MTTDRELLELAAKAIGINELRGAGTKYHCYYVTGEETAVKWNPLKDDGDALRLAVKLGMSVNMFPNDDARTECASHLQNNFVDEAWRHHADPCAATRRAVVRAAAEIGKDMK